MFLTNENDLDSTESQPPSTRRHVAHAAIAAAFGLAGYALQDQFHNITKELSAPPA